VICGGGEDASSSMELLRRPEMAKFLKIMKNSKGATAIEYGLIAALIAVAAIAAMQNIGTKLGTTFNNVSNAL
jgi:pilus assembly protein Flp/PilA